MTEAPVERPTFSRREINSIMLGLILALFLANLDQTIVATSLTTMARDLDGWTLMPWVVSAYLITSTTTVPIYGKLSDLYGRRPVLLSAIGPVGLAVTTNFNINFLRKGQPGRDVLAAAKLLKLGKRLAVGEVVLLSGTSPDPIAHVTATYSIPNA